MLPWLKVAAMRASLTNMRTNDSSPESSGRMRLSTTDLLTPAAPAMRASQVSAIPPMPRRWVSSYRPKRCGCTRRLSYVPLERGKGAAAVSRGARRGQATVEAALTVPLALFLVLGGLQVLLSMQARLMAQYAVARATKVGAANFG